MPQTVGFAWKDGGTSGGFRTGVSLHGHTMHSEECLSFLPRYLHQAPGVSQIVSGYERKSGPIDFARAWWTPPLSPACALRIERKQIADLGLRALVSLTDHDNIEAGRSLQVAADSREVPVSVEWTVPYARSIFHLGIHNLPPGCMRELAEYTAAPREERLPDLLSELARIPEVLIVLNHPFWLEEGVDAMDHGPALSRLLRECIDWLQAFELNGTRRWKENRRVVELAAAHARPVISGGDRHACEPSACINLTNAASFAEFVSEIRAGHSAVHFMPQYREPMAARILEMAWDILRPYTEYPGRERWTDRIFYRGEDGAARSLAAMWGNHVPWMLTGATGLVQFLAAPGLRVALRHFLQERGEIRP